MAEIAVKLALSEYIIHIRAGILTELSRLCRKSHIGKRLLVVSDEKVGSLYGDMVCRNLAIDFEPELVCVAVGENSKSLETAQFLYTKAINCGLDRSSAIVALGGGVVGDLAGFVASTYLRGISFVQIPTSLLAQVDSSVGGKVAVNHCLGKNLIGNFYQPKFVAIDPQCLLTLPQRELQAGLAEVIKYGAIADKEFFDYVFGSKDEILALNFKVLTEVIANCCKIKSKVVEADEREAAVRIILNFGHTIGHAVEASTNYSLYNHGEAVAIGMYAAALLSFELGLCNQSVVDELYSVITSYGLPTYAPECNQEDLYNFILRDKKTTERKTKWILLRDIGDIVIKDDVPWDVVHNVLRFITNE